MITPAELKTQTKADLAKIAKRLGVASWAAMKKDQLVAAVAKASKASVKTSGDVRKANTSRKVASSGNAAKSAKVNGHAGRVKSATAGTARKAGSIASAPAKATGAKKSAKAVSKATSTPAPAKTTLASKAKLTSTKAPSTKAPTTKAPTIKAPTIKAPTIKAPSKVSVKAVDDQTAAAVAGTESLSPRKPHKAVSAKNPAKAKPAPTPTDPRVLKRIRELQLQKQSDKDIAFRPTLVRHPGAVEPVWEKEPVKDRIALFVRDAHWMHASWDITRNAIERAKAAMLEQWHGAKPVLRLLRMDDTGTTSTSETVERDIPIHGGSRNWYVEWSGESTRFRVLIGYLSPNGRFHAMAKSNIVKTPNAGSSDTVDEHWSDLGAESERIFATSGGYDSEVETGELKEMLEDRLNRTLGAPPLAQLGSGADGPFRRRGGFHFDMDVELMVYGSTVPDGYLTLNGEPVTLRSDGTFMLRVPFPDRRQVLPAVACSRDGSQQRTIVVAVERNTKIMEPLETEQDTGE